MPLFSFEGKMYESSLTLPQYMDKSRVSCSALVVVVFMVLGGCKLASHHSFKNDGLPPLAACQ